MRHSPVAPPTEKELTFHFNSEERDTPKVQETSYLPS